MAHNKEAIAENFEVGDLIWGKTRGFVPWPGQVSLHFGGISLMMTNFFKIFRSKALGKQRNIVAKTFVILDVFSNVAQINFNRNLNF